MSGLDPIKATVWLADITDVYSQVRIGPLRSSLHGDCGLRCNIGVICLQAKAAVATV
jgi:hypothetical protein